MSRQTIISELLTKGKLYRHTSLAFEALGIPHDETARTLYISAEISAAVTGPFPETDEGDRLAEFRAWLDGFIEGAELSISDDPDQKPPKTMLARVHDVEKEFWSIRVTQPEDTPGIRSLGAFSDIDEFVALTWEMREDIDDFDDQVESTIEMWKDLFGSTPPHSGDRLDEYLTIFFLAN